MWGTLATAAAGGAILVGGGCGARTGLPVTRGEVTGDASTDEASDAPVPEDALPPIDTFVPDVARMNECPDGSATLVYLITEQNTLLSFYPATLTFTTIGAIDCPGTRGTGATPFSMGVDRRGIAYSCFSDGRLFELSTANASCKPTGFVPGQRGFTTFCMGYAGLADGGERLYVVDCDLSRKRSLGLGWIDTSAFDLSFIGGFRPGEPDCELTGTADGLFGFCLRPGGGSKIIQIDPNDAHVIAENDLRVGNPNDGFAFAYWGGAFWVFTTSQFQTFSTVTRWTPGRGSMGPTEENVTTYPDSIVGAGVSTCAPASM